MWTYRDWVSTVSLLNFSAVIKTKAHPEGEEVSRKYTPVSSIKTKGKIEILVKVYFKNVHPNFPEGGIMSQYLYDMQIGESINVRGNISAKHLVFLAGGSGITPFYQVRVLNYFNFR